MGKALKCLLHPSLTLTPPKVTDEASQMSELAGANQQGEDKVRGCSAA